MKNIPTSVIEQAYTYENYRTLIDTLFAEDKTTGADHSPAMLNYTKLNLSRMNRLDKRSRLTDTTIESLAKINRPVIWLVLTEGWCGDAAQIVPVLNQMAVANDNITLRFILRDENLTVTDAFLTNGARAIPKVLVLDATTLEVLTTWGPRPAEMQKMVLDAKAASLATEDKEERKAISNASANNLHLWYAKDKTKTIQVEFLAALDIET
ncbi:MAG: thioredoxin family protein [Saprospiraceae bacterium]